MGGFTELSRTLGLQLNPRGGNGQAVGRRSRAGSSLFSFDSLDEASRAAAQAGVEVFSPGPSIQGVMPPHPACFLV